MQARRSGSGAPLGELRIFLDECYEELDGDEFEEYSARVVTTLSRLDVYVPEAMDMIAHFCDRVAKIVEACGTHRSDLRQIQALSNVLHIVEENFMAHQASSTSKESQRRQRRYRDIQRYCKEARHKVESISNNFVTKVTKSASDRRPPLRSKLPSTSRPRPSSQGQIASPSPRQSPSLPRTLSSTFSRSSSRSFHSPSVKDPAHSERSLSLDDPVKVEEVESIDIDCSTVPEVYNISDHDDDEVKEALEDSNRGSVDMDMDSEDEFVTEDSLWIAQYEITPWFKVDCSLPSHPLTFSLDATHPCFTQISPKVDEEDETKQISAELVLFIKIIVDPLNMDNLGFQLWITDVDCDPPEILSQNDDQSLYWIILPRASLKPGVNSLECGIKFNSSAQNPLTEMSLNSVMMCSIEQITEAVLKKKCSPVRTQGLINIFLKNNQKFLTGLHPSSQKLIKVPVRGDGCPHLECFDLNTFLKHNQGASGKWDCPVVGCVETCRPGSLELDLWVAENFARFAGHNQQDGIFISPSALDDQLVEDVDIKPEV
ncbi:hypothetical protein DFH28DRAFT_448449 [Melampsora americana]|nr:hypothetical protein DFH28DRAFT_448449 [Melampsora americana]